MKQTTANLLLPVASGRTTRDGFDLLFQRLGNEAGTREDWQEGGWKWDELRESAERLPLREAFIHNDMLRPGRTVAANILSRVTRIAEHRHREAKLSERSFRELETGDLTPPSARIAEAEADTDLDALLANIDAQPASEEPACAPVPAPLMATIEPQPPEAANPASLLADEQAEARQAKRARDEIASAKRARAGTCA